jgi:hypothetical protein
MENSNAWKFWNNIIKLSSDKTKDCINEWERIDENSYYLYLDEFNLIDKYYNDEKDMHFCICNHHDIQKIFYFKNKITNEYIKVGSSCVNLFMHHEYILIQEQKGILMAKAREIRKKIKGYRCPCCLSLSDKKKDCFSCRFISNRLVDELDILYIKKIRCMKFNDMNHSTRLQIKLLDIRKQNKKEKTKFIKEYIDLSYQIEKEFYFKIKDIVY